MNLFDASFVGIALVGIQDSENTFKLHRANSIFCLPKPKCLKNQYSKPPAKLWSQVHVSLISGPHLHWQFHSFMERSKQVAACTKAFGDVLLANDESRFDAL